MTQQATENQPGTPTGGQEPLPADGGGVTAPTTPGNAEGDDDVPPPSKDSPEA